MKLQLKHRIFSLAALVTVPLSLAAGETAAASQSPYDRQVGEACAKLAATDAGTRRVAVETLGVLRDFDHADALLAALDDPAAAVRRNAATALGWCGGRQHLATLASRLDDADWSVRQAAHVAMGNLSGMEFPFDGLAAEPLRRTQAAAWRAWIAELKPGVTPPAVLALITQPQFNLASGCPVTASSTYSRHGTPKILTDGHLDAYWQTKDVPFPQSCTVDLKTPQEVACVIVHQFQANQVMTQYALESSVDGKSFKTVRTEKKTTDQRLVISFPPSKMRFIRIVALAGMKPRYPTTFSEIEVFATPPASKEIERGIRALGALGGAEAESAIIRLAAPFLAAKGNITDPEQKTLVQATIRALGRLRGPQAFPTLVQFLHKTQWAHYAADALADLGDPRAIPEIVGVFPEYARLLNGDCPKSVPLHDAPGLSPIDRIYVTPYAVAFALSRLSTHAPDAAAQIRPLIPLLLANIPGDLDAAMLYEREAWQLVFGHLLDLCGLRQAACDVAFRQLGSTRPRPTVPETAALEKLVRTGGKRGAFVNESSMAGTWLAAFCDRPSDRGELLALLTHANGWVRINAAKALVALNSPEAAPRLLAILAAAKSEADYGYCGTFNFTAARPAGQDEYSDPCPRWREAFIYGLGQLRAADAVPLLVKILESDRNVMEIRYAAAVALDRIGTPAALDALRVCESSHPYHTVRIVAREALWKRGLAPLPPAISPPLNPATANAAANLAVPQPLPAAPPGALPSIVFIKGALKAPNAYQSDNWRQLYATTDSGPTYRLGDNLFRLDGAGTATPNVVPLTRFTDGYVADCEVSWDAKRILFCHRGGDSDPWWHVFEMNADGTGLRQITDGPYHDVQPNYLPDGRIVFSSSRLGARDEYHGYLATGLTIMNPNGSDIHAIGINLGRDAEPVMLEDGRIGFSRLELFYSRLKTEWNVEAAYPDGTKNVVLYGPERRQFWLDYSRHEGIGWTIAGLRHRTLRISQLQPFRQEQLLAITQNGLTLVGNDRYSETFIPHDPLLVVTSPFPLDTARILCAAGPKIYPRSKTNPLKTTPGNQIPTDLGLYLCDAKTGKLDCLYNDPKTADFEPRPLTPRTPPVTLPENPASRSSQYTGRIVCSSALFTQEQRVRERGRYVRIIEAQPSVTRHQTQTSNAVAWKNHTGTKARVLATVPLGADGSFNLEVPADRFFHCQVLDSDRQVVGNQQIWMYVRPGEVRSCIGCHEQPGTSPVTAGFPDTSRVAPIPCLPADDIFTYRAKIWNKGTLSDEEEERTRTAQAINVLGRN